MRMEAEYLVVGAGAAGCTAGYLLRQAGADVLTVESQDAQSKDKLCGGLLGKADMGDIVAAFGRDAIDELGVSYLSHIVYRTLDKEFVCDFPSATIERKRLDDWILDRYRASGGRLRDRMRVVGIELGQRVAQCVDLRTRERVEIGFGTIIGADGAASATRHLLTGRRQRVVPSVEGIVAPRGDDIVFEYRVQTQGYCWYIPTGNVANVGCGIYDGTARDCRAWLADFCQKMSIPLPQLRGAPIPSGDDVLLRAGDHAWLVGDAAGLAWPTDGAGIAYAISSATHLAAALLGGPSYEDAMQPTIARFAEAAEKRRRYFPAITLRICLEGTLL